MGGYSATFTSSSLGSYAGKKLSTLSWAGSLFSFLWELVVEVAVVALSFLRLLTPRLAFSFPPCFFDEDIFALSPWRCFLIGDSFSKLTFSWCRFLYPDFPLARCESFLAARGLVSFSFNPPVFPWSTLWWLLWGRWLLTWIFLKGLAFLF